MTSQDFKKATGLSLSEARSFQAILRRKRLVYLAKQAAKVKASFSFLTH